MERRVWLLRVKEGKEEEYRHVHTAVWPEPIRVAKEAGLKNHSSFISGRNVVAYGQAEDIEATFVKILATDVKKRWDQMMSSILEETDSPPFEEAFHFD
jgi:L-rhamnose mutarotase